MKKVLVFLHVEAEGPGTLGDFLDSFGIRVKKVRLYEGENLPSDGLKYDAIITMGGPMNVDEDDRYPFLKKEVAFLKKAVTANVPILGICLGAQLIARACRAGVTKMEQEEQGWKKVFLTDSGKRDSLFQRLPDYMTVFQWHGDTFEIPHGGALLATARECANQAFRYRNAYGLQFHIEVTDRMIGEWFDGHPQREDYLHQLMAIERTYYSQACQIFGNFIWFADLCRRMSDRRVKSSFNQESMRKVL
ncbi:MAG: type 1 glutamine amidotransferase [Deltaproteobacteria bacterium]|nr:type 1 glutamine amidotransferase [Deltaproteobacteria bacterium]